MGPRWFTTRPGRGGLASHPGSPGGVAPAATDVRGRERYRFAGTTVTVTLDGYFVE